MKTKKVIGYVLVTILALCAFVFGYYTELKVQHTENGKETENEETKQSEAKEVSYALGKQLVDSIENVYSVDYYEYFKNGIEKIDNDTLIKNAIYANSKSNESLEDVNVTEEQVKEYVQKYFGENYKYENKDIICPLDKNPLFVYKDGTYTFAKDATHGHGGGSISQRDTKVYVESVEYAGKDIEVKARIAYSGKCGDTCGPLNAYYSYSREVVFGDPKNDYATTFTNKDLEEVKDKLETTTFTFSANKDGSYYLSNVTVK